MIELKKILEIDPNDNTENVRLGLYNEWCSSLIETLLNRDFSFKTRTQYYNGTNTQKLLLRNRPVYTATVPIQCFVDGSGFYGTAPGAFASNTALVYGTDFTLWIDDDDGTSSKRGILIRLKGYTWERPYYRRLGLLAPFVGDAYGNIKVIYQAGYTVDTLPGAFRLAAGMLVSKIRYLFPLGVPLNSESYEERSLGIIGERKDWLLADIKPILLPYRNWCW